MLSQFKRADFGKNVNGPGDGKFAGKKLGELVVCEFVRLGNQLDLLVVEEVEEVLLLDRLNDVHHVVNHVANGRQLLAVEAPARVLFVIAKVLAEGLNLFRVKHLHLVAVVAVLAFGGLNHVDLATACVLDENWLGERVVHVNVKQQIDRLRQLQTVDAVRGENELLFSRSLHLEM